MLKSRTIVALALLVLVGGATAWKLTRRDPHVADERAPRPVTIPKDIDELELTDEAKPPVALKKDGGSWKVTAPFQDKADQKAVEQAVDTLAEMKLRDVIAESPESYEKVGVKDGETLKIVAKKGGAAVATLHLGKTGNLRVEGKPQVWSTANLKRWALAKEPKAWRDRKVMDFPIDQAERVDVVYPAGKIAVKKETPPAPPAPPPAADGKAPPAPPPAGPDKWNLVEGEALVGGTVDPNVALETASTLARLNGEDVAPADAKTGMDAPRAKLTVTLKDGKTQTLLLGAADDKVAYVKVDGSDRVWTIPKYEADRLPASPGAWRDKTVVRVPPDDVTRVEIAKGDVKTVLVRDKDGWKATAPAGLDVDGARVTSLLRSTEVLRATKLLDGDARANGLDKPRGSIALTTKDGKTTKLLFGAEKENDAPVQVAGQMDVWGVPAYLVNNLMKSPDDLKKQATASADPHGN